MVEAFFCSPAPGDVDVKTNPAQIHRHLDVVLVLLRVWVTRGRIEYIGTQFFDEVRDSIAIGILNGDGAVERAVVQEGASTHLGFAKENGEFQQGFDVVVGVEERETLGKEGEQDDTS